MNTLRRAAPALLLACLFSTLPGSAGAAAGSPKNDREAIGRALHSIEAGVAARDATAAMAAYDTADPAFAARSRESLKAWLGMEDISVTYRVARVKASGKSAEAVVFRRVGYKEHGRARVESRWETVRARRTPSGWTVTAEDDRTFSRCDTTDLRVEVNPEAGTLRGTSTLRFTITAAGETSVLMQLNRGVEIRSMSDGRNRPVRFDREADSIVIPQPAPLRAGETGVLTIAFEGKLFNEAKEQGFSQVSIAPAGSFASWVTSWYPHLQGDGSKSRGTLTYVVPEGVTVAANGRLSAVRPEGLLRAHVFTVDRPLDFSFAAAKYFHRETQVDGIPLGVYLLRGGEAKADLYLKKCAELLRYQQELYGRYPTDGYALVEIPSEETGGLGGSSEQGMNLFPAGILPDDSFPLLLLAHEMGHGWWGNLVQAGDTAVLDEGLAQMTAVLCLEKFEGEKAMRRFLKNGIPAYGQSAQMYFARFAGSSEKDWPLSATAVGSDAGSAQHDIADTKGMFVYNMLRERIGHESFVRGLRRIVQDFAGKTVTVRDLRRALEESSKTNLEGFFRQWFDRTGAADLVLDASVAAGESGVVVSGNVVQAGEPYDVAVEIVLASQGTRVVKTLSVSGPSTPFSFRVEARPEFVVLDPEYKILRWTPAFRNAALLGEGTALSSVGRNDVAVRKLQEFAEKAPDSLEGRYRLGVAWEESGKLDAAEKCFRAVLERYRALDVYEPAVSLSQLHLGRVFDLMGRRDDAKTAYRETLELPDESSAHRDAKAGLAAPYQMPVRAKGPAPDAMARFAGTYDNDKGLTVEVLLDDNGILKAGQPGKAPAILQWIEGKRFHVSAATEVVLEFVGSPEITALDLTIGTNVIRLPRKK